MNNLTVMVHAGDSVLTRDLVWCDCGRGLSLTGRWLYCPSCGGAIDPESYHAAVEQALCNSAVLYKDAETVELQLAVKAVTRHIENGRCIHSRDDFDALMDDVRGLEALTRKSL